MNTLYPNSGKFKITFIIFFITLFAFSAFAQETTTNVQGTVTDATGALVPNATITLTPKACKCSDCSTVSPCPMCCAPQNASTDSDGSFRFTNVRIRSYVVTVESAGFKSTSVEVTPSVGASTTVNIVLDSGSAAEQVSVTSEGGTNCDLVCLVKKIFKKIF
jgi:hypothetical protein